MNAPNPPAQQILSRELGVYETQKCELVSTAAGKYVLIKDSEIVGLFDTYATAAGEGWARFGNVPFLVKEIAAAETPRTFTPTALKHACDELAIPSPTSLAGDRSSR